jgi:hypothetical protein
MLHSMTSSHASSRCRIELPADRVGVVMAIAGALLAAVGVALTRLPPLAAVALWCVAAAIVGLQWRWRRQRRPQALLLLAPDHVELEAGTDEPRPARLRDWRRLGPLVVLEFADAEPRRLDLWLPSLPLNDRHALLRQLPRMRPQPGPSV